MTDKEYDILHRILHGEKLVYEGLGTMTTDAKPLHPLTHGKILMVGVKASNFDDEIRTHPRIIMWDSQNEHWLNKNMPDNVQAVFMTRFIGHDAFTNIVKEARKRRITIFNPQGTGLIAKQVKELLNIGRETPVVTCSNCKQPFTVTNTHWTTCPKCRPIEPKVEVTTMPSTLTQGTPGKLKPLYPFIDFSKGNKENAEILFKKAKELGINTTLVSLTQMVTVQRRRSGTAPLRQKKVKSPKVTQVKSRPMDVSVEILNNIIKELQDMRDFINDTVAENTRLRAKVDKFKKFFDE